MDPLKATLVTRSLLLGVVATVTIGDPMASVTDVNNHGISTGGRYPSHNSAADFKGEHDAAKAVKGLKGKHYFSAIESPHTQRSKAWANTSPSGLATRNTDFIGFLPLTEAGDTYLSEAQLQAVANNNAHGFKPSYNRLAYSPRVNFEDRKPLLRSAVYDLHVAEERDSNGAVKPAGADEDLDAVTLGSRFIF